MRSAMRAASQWLGRGPSSRPTVVDMAPVQYLQANQKSDDDDNCKMRSLLT